MNSEFTRTENHDRILYYLAAEKRLIEISRYISIKKENFSASSVELTKVLMSISIEINNILDEMISSNQKKFKFKKSINISKPYQKYELAKIPPQEIVSKIKWHCIPLFQTMLPWKDDIWWEAYTMAKHSDRGKTHYATLEEVLYAMLDYCHLIFQYEHTKNQEMWRNIQQFTRHPFLATGLFTLQAPELTPSELI